MQNSFFSDEEMGVNTQYRVLARKYRPTTFKDMIGQEVMVRTLTNAMASGRLAHAFVLTGIRGVGKTTTARIIARAINCIGADGNGNMTPDPCGVCIHCKAIADDRHQDILEMDAASHTSVNDIREIIENTRYKPISARYKIYIIDEVHMLSNSAFNALLKTLEEPPAHVKFIFATTEIRKIPITILSRCQRFDLKRVEARDLVAHFKNILALEKLEAEEDALKLIASVSGGSVRDGLSILDQALASNGNNITAATVRDMLGLADRSTLYRLFENIIEGKIKDALEIVEEQYRNGADPALIITDLLEINHTVSKLKLAEARSSELAELEQESCTKLAKSLNIPYLARQWQMLQKGLEEIKNSYSPFAALEMIIIRITHASNLPSLESVVKKIENFARSPEMPSIQTSQPEKSANNNLPIALSDFEKIINLCFEQNEMMLYHHLKNNVEFVSLENNNLAFRLLPDAPKNIHLTLQEFLTKSTGQEWKVISSSKNGCETVAALEKSQEQLYIEKIVNDDSVQKVLKNFDDLEIIDIKKN